MNSDLEQLNKMLEIKEKIANQMANNDHIESMKEQYQVQIDLSVFCHTA